MANAVAAPDPSPRLDAIDAVRGAVMVLMLLDHARDFCHVGGLFEDALDLRTTTPLLYATRWITHLCAPTFVFLAGLGAALQRLRGKPAAVLARFLWTRGLWLVFLELTLMRTVIWFNWDLSLLAFLQVIWAIGISMVILAAFVRLPSNVVGGLGLVIVLLHNLLGGFRVTPWQGPGSPVPSLLGKLWILLYQGGLFPVAGFPSPLVFSLYAILPWLGVMMAGYGAVRFYALPTARRGRALVGLGALLLAAFALLRFSNLYGDPRPWAPQADLTRTVMSFLNVSKYPASALFVLVTLGVSLTALGLLEGRVLSRGLGRVLVVFGRVPLFFYVLQWVAAHVAGMTITAALGKDIHPYFMNLAQLIASPTPVDIGGPLRFTYVAWILGTVLLYFPCRWYAGVKARRRDWWLGYL